MVTGLTKKRGRTGDVLISASLLALLATSGCNKQEETREPFTQRSGGGGGAGGGGGGAFSSVQNKLTTQTAESKGIFGWLGGSKPMSGSSEQTTITTTDVMPAPPPPSAPVTAALPQIVAEQAAPMTAMDGVTRVASEPVSTFAVDVDTSSYSSMRRAMLSGQRPDPSSVRVEEMVNYFRYELPPAPSGDPFSITTDVVRNPWNPSTLIMRVGLNGRVVPTAARPAANIVLLVDVSGSMSSDDRLPLIQRSFADMVDHLGPKDRVSIVTYADGAQVVLPSTSDHSRIKAALAGLSSSGGTAGGEGLRLAYAQARAARISGGINRVMIASDGDFNVGMSDTPSLKRYIEQERDDGITLTTLGVGERFNDSLMETMADAGNGSAAFLDDDLEARKVLRDELESSIHMIAKDVKAQVEFNPTAVLSYRLIGYRNRRLAERDFDDDKVDAGEIGSGHQVTALYEITPVSRAASPAYDDVAQRRRYEANRVRGESLAEPAPTASVGEAAFVKLRFKRPDGARSELIQRPVPADALYNAQSPTGDTAFAIAVAAFGQRLDNSIPATFSARRIVDLAGAQGDGRRREFIDLVNQRAELLDGTISPPRVYARPAGTPVDPFNGGYSPTIANAGIHDRVPTSAWLLGLGAIIAFAFAARRHWWWHGLDRAVRRDADSKPAPETAHVPSAPSASTGPVISTEALDTALRTAAAETGPDGRQAIRVFSTTASRAVAAAQEDDAITAEVEAILTRHAPGFLDEYVRAIRRATPSTRDDLNASLVRTLDTMADRLGELMRERAEAAADAVGDRERFIDRRHGQPRDALA